MVKAVLMAGGGVNKNKNSMIYQIRKFLDHKINNYVYNENYLFGVYKPLRNAEGYIDGKLVIAPMMKFGLDRLEKSRHVEEVVVVGEKDSIYNVLGDYIKEYNKKISVVQQAGEFLDNAVLGYKNTGNSGHVLFVVSDTIHLKHESIDNFITQCGNYENYPIIYQLAKRDNLKKFEKIFHRPYCWIMDDDPDTKNKGSKDRFGRKGYRMGAMAYADFRSITNMARVELLYRMRKMRNPANIAKLLFQNKNLVRKYLNKTLTKSFFERELSDYFGAPFKFVEVEDGLTAIDLDSREDEESNKKILGKIRHCKQG